MEIVIAGGAERWIKKRFNNTIQDSVIVGCQCLTFDSLKYAPFVQRTIVNCIVCHRFFSAFNLKHSFQMERSGIEWILYCIRLSYVCVCERKCMKIRSEKEGKKQIESHRNEIFAILLVFTLVFLFKFEKATDLRFAKALPLKAFTRTQSTPEKREKKRIYQFHLAESVHTHTNTHTLHTQANCYAIPKANLSSIRAQCFFSIKMSLCVAFSKWYATTGRFIHCTCYAFSLVFHLDFILSQLWSYSWIWFHGF